MAPFPEMRLEHTHLLITKTLLTLNTLDLVPSTGDKGHFHMVGKAGTREDKSIDVKVDADRLPLVDWVPGDWRNHISGLVTAQIHWTGKDPKLQSAAGDAAVRVEDGRLYGLPFLQKMAALTNDQSCQSLTLENCRFDVSWQYPRLAIKHLVIEDKGKFRAEGEVEARRDSLGGAIELGLAPHLLNWLPDARQIFSREHDGYLWTRVHLSGTPDAPQQDLSERITSILKEHPTAVLTLFFRQLGQSLRLFNDGKGE